MSDVADFFHADAPWGWGVFNPGEHVPRVSELPGAEVVLEGPWLTVRLFDASGAVEFTFSRDFEAPGYAEAIGFSIVADGDVRPGFLRLLLGEPVRHSSHAA